MIFLSIASTQAIKGHVVIGIIVDRFPKRIQSIIEFVTHSIGLVVSILAFKQSVEEGFFMMQMGDTSMVLQIPIYPFYFIVALGWILFSLTMIVQLVQLIFSLKDK
ncbi:MAG: TRAP transporter small permease [Candidatus Hodarchaeota archaeon]